MMIRLTTLLVALWAPACYGANEATNAAQQWGQWRGPTANGVSDAGNPPVTWSEHENIRWKVKVAGRGLSTPIVWGNAVFLQSAIPGDPDAEATPKEDSEARRAPRADGQPREGARGPHPGDGPGARRGRDGRGRRGGRDAVPTESYRFAVIALDRHTGQELWQKTVFEGVPHEGSHRDGSLAPASPVTDGAHLFAYFGSRGLYCLTMSGDVVWEKNLGTMSTRNGFGEGSSPALHGDTLVVNWDHEGDSFIVALDKNTGQERWRRQRDEVTSWSTPLIVDDAGTPRVVVSATKRVRAYDLATGDVVWQLGGLGVNCAPSPVATGDMVFAMSGYRDPALLAIRYPGATGDLAGSDKTAWSTTKGTSYVPSPLLYDDTLYFLQKNAGILSCLDARTGDPHYDQQRLDDTGGVYASPVGAGGRVYVTGRNGTTYVLKHGRSFEVLAVNKLDESFSASPAVVGTDLLLRGEKHLYCIGAP